MLFYKYNRFHIKKNDLSSDNPFQCDPLLAFANVSKCMQLC